MNHTFIGDHGPVKVMQNGRQIAGAVRTRAGGEGRVEFESIYNAALPSVKVCGAGKQDKLEGRNLVSNLWTDFTEGHWNTPEQGSTPEIVVRPDRVALKKYIRVTPGSVLYISTQSDLISLGFRVLNKNEEYTGRTFLTASESKELLSDDAYYLAFFLFGTTSQAEYEKMFASGKINPYISEISDVFEPYCGAQPAPNPQYPIDPVFLEGASVVGRGRNLWAISNITIIKNQDFELPITCPPGKYNFSAVVKSNDVDSNVCLVLVMGIYGMYLYPKIERSLGNRRVSLSFEANEPFKNFTLYASNNYSNSIGDTASFSDIQLEYGSTPTPYEPHYDGGTVPLPILRGTKDGKYRDTHNAITGVTERKLRKLVLDGTEPWVQTGVVVSACQGYALESSAYNALQDDIEGFCNALVYDPKEKTPNSFSQNSSEYGLRVVISRAIVPNGTGEEWKAYLAKRFTDGNPIVLTYIIATPIIEHYDPAILRQHPGYTQIIQQGGFQPARIEAEYYKEMTV